MMCSPQRMVQRPLFLSTLVFLDLETTGLPSPSFKPEITELCMLAASRFSLEQPTPVRVQNKLNICFHPVRTMNSIAAKVSGLNADNLFYQKDFDADAVKLIQLFLTRLDPPVCLLAHNGIRFDFPLLRAQLQSFSGPDFRLLDCRNSAILCADTLHLFTELNSQLVPTIAANDSGFVDEPIPCDGLPVARSSPKKVREGRVSFQLGDIYARVFGSGHSNAHSAEGDCIAVMNLVQHLGLNAIDWLQVNYTDFNSIRPMYQLRSTPSSQREFPYELPTEKIAAPTAVTDAATWLRKVRLE